MKVAIDTFVLGSFFSVKRVARLIAVATAGTTGSTSLT
jgi:hypothetical protein